MVTDRYIVCVCVRPVTDSLGLPREPEPAAADAIEVQLTVAFAFAFCEGVRIGPRLRPWRLQHLIF